MPFSLKDVILQKPSGVVGPRRARTVEEEDAIRAARTPAQRRLENAMSLLFGAIGLPISDSDERPNQWSRAGELLSAAVPVAGSLRAVKSVRIPRKMSAEALENMRRRYAGDFYDKVEELGQTATDALRKEWPGPYNMHPDELAELRTSPDWKQLPEETRALLREMGKANWFEHDMPYAGAKAAFDLGHIQPDAPREAVQKAILESYPKNLRRAMSRYMTKALGK